MRGRFVLAANIDGDEDLDVVAAGPSHETIKWYENLDGAGSFGPPREIGNGYLHPLSLEVADLDGDGDLDVLVASDWYDTVAWYKNKDGAGDFSNHKVVNASVQGARCAVARDVDGDGDLDVITAAHDTDKIAWYRNTDGLGSFGSINVISTSANGAISVWGEDLDGDGDQDVLSASEDDDKIAWYENTDGAGGFGPQEVISTAADGPTVVLAADLDGDGDADALSVSERDDELAWYPNTDGLGAFGPQRIIMTQADLATCVVACDLDGDGDLDALSASSGDHKIAWYENTDGLGTFGQQRVEELVTSPDALCPADLDGDGDLDVIVGGNDLYWFENTDGQGSLGPYQLLSPDHVGSACASDLDGDGDLDVLAALTGPIPTISWFENTDGQGTFGAQQAIQARVSGSLYAGAADLDGDGDQDIFYITGIYNALSWNRNLGGGVFGMQEYVTGLLDAGTAACAADLDGDGDLDLLTSEWNGGKVAWYRNFDGLGSFGDQIVLTDQLVYCDSIFVTDMDGDGDQDVLACSVEQLVWFQNADGHGTFGPPQVVATLGHVLRSVHAADLTGDGAPDVLFASSHLNKVAWCENNGIATSSFRNADTNWHSHRALNLPVLGTTYVCTVDLASTSGHSFAWLAGFGSPLNLPLGPHATLLVNIGDASGELLHQPIIAGPIATFRIAIPNEPALSGLRVYTQALQLGGLTPFHLSNAQDLILGY
jgi:hypothetical protein